MAKYTKLELPELNDDSSHMGNHMGNKLQCDFYPDGAAMLLIQIGQSTGFVMIHLSAAQVNQLGGACLSQQAVTAEIAVPARQSVTIHDYNAGLICDNLCGYCGGAFDYMGGESCSCGDWYCHVHFDMHHCPHRNG